VSLGKVMQRRGPARYRRWKRAMCKELYLKRKERDEILMNKAVKSLVDKQGDFEVKSNGEEQAPGKQEVERRGKGRGKTIKIYSNNMNGGLTQP